VTDAGGFRPIEMRLVPELRRCAVYAAVGAVAAIGLLVWLELAGLNPQQWEAAAVLGGGFALGAIGLLAAAFRYRVRIDERGVWRRRFVRWDLWPWGAFAAGLVRHGKLGDQLTYPEKSWYWRTISTSVLGEANRVAFEAAVAQHWVPPPPPELPDTLDIRHGLRTRLELSADGVRVKKNRHDAGELVPWPGVVRVEVVRASHGRPDFVTLTLHLRDQPAPVTLRHHQGEKMWKGADAEAIARFVQRHAGERFEVIALRGPPADAAEADRRLARLDRMRRQLREDLRQCSWIFGASLVVLGFVGADVWDQPNPLKWGQKEWAAVEFWLGLAVASFGLLFAVVLGIMYSGGRFLRRQGDEVLHWKAEHAG
jgi:hypothetical protein